MHPTLIEILLFGRTFALDARGAFVALGAVTALLLFDSRARAAGVPKVEARQLGLALLLVGLVGARLIFLVAHAPTYLAQCRAARDALDDPSAVCWRPLWVWEEGLSPVGGTALALVWLIWRSRKRTWPALRIADLAAAPLALAHAIGRVGCFLSGCCFGRVTDSAWGVRFPPESAAFQALVDEGRLAMSAPSTPPLQPVQLYEAASYALLFVALSLLPARRDGTRFLGFVLGSAIIVVALTPLSDPSVRAAWWLSLAALGALAVLTSAARARAA
jgi:phosphatidylglycerol:prolipoprotein diacylglycerol transferase